MTEQKCARCDGEGWIAATDRECRTCDGDGVTYVYTIPSHVAFVEDMQNAGFRVKHYNGRAYYRGPAVFTDEENGVSKQDVYGATRVRLREDTLGRRDYVVYPG